MTGFCRFPKEQTTKAKAENRAVVVFGVDDRRGRIECEFRADLNVGETLEAVVFAANFGLFDAGELEVLKATANAKLDAHATAKRAEKQETA